MTVNNWRWVLVVLIFLSLTYVCFAEPINQISKSEAKRVMVLSDEPMECTVMDVVPKGVEVRCDDGTWFSIPRYSFEPEPAFEGQTVKMEWVDGQLQFSTDKQ